MVMSCVCAPPVAELPVVIVTGAPPMTVVSCACDKANVWTCAEEDEVSPETPAAGGVWTSVLFSVTECVCALTLVEVNVFVVSGGGGVVELEHLDWTNATRAPNEPNSPVTRNFFLVMLTSF
jgi:hypothetical protein